MDSRRSAFCTRYKREPARQTALVRVIDRLTSISFRLAAVLFVCATLMHVTGFHLAHPQAAHAGDYFYTANDSEMATIVNWHDETNATNVTPWPNWPEQASNWCGIANIQAINAYAWWKQGQSGNNQYPDQFSVYNLLNSSSAVSPWGASVRSGYVKANISGDAGTDPRSITWGLYTTTPYGYYYHNYIYPGTNGVAKDTQNFASDYGSAGLNNPISVTINHGAHSVVVSGVEADRDPSTNASTVNIYSIDVWDPWYGAPSIWGYHNYYNSTGVHQWIVDTDWTGWSGARQWWYGYYQTNNGVDPEPLTSPGSYYNVPPLIQHWVGNYVTIEQVTIPPSTYSENIALDNYGNPVQHS